MPKICTYCLEYHDAKCVAHKLHDAEKELDYYRKMYKSTKFPVRFRIRDLVIIIDRVKEEEKNEL